MGITTEAPPLTVPQARRRLANTRGLSSEQVAELETVVASFHTKRPRDRACVACGSMRWSEHTDGADESVWACAGCHRASSLEAAEWWAQRQAAEAARTAQEARDAAPEPRAALGDALAARRDAAEALARLEQGLGAVRAALASAQVKHGAAVAAMAEAEQAAITRLTASITGTRASTSDAATQGAARGQLRTAEDALSAARGAKALLDGQAEQARRNLANTHDGVHAAALRVIAAEALEPLIEQAVQARADYISAVGGLAWFLRNGAVPNGDARAAQLVAEASETPPGRWREAAAADGGMAQRLAELATPL